MEKGETNMYVFDRNKARQLQAKLAEQNLDNNLAKLLDFFKYDYSMLTDFENKLGSKDFNLLRSHLLACKIDQNRYLAAIKGSSQFTELCKLANQGALVIDKLKSKPQHFDEVPLSRESEF